MSKKIKINKKQVVFNHFAFEVVKVYSKEYVELTNDCTGNIVVFDETMDALFANGNRNENSLFIFRDVWNDEMIAHECYHAFFHLLDNMGGNDKVEYKELANEVYAYRFSDLFAEVKKTLESL